MSTPHPGFRWLGVLATAAILAGCSSATVETAGPSQASSQASPSAGAAQVPGQATSAATDGSGSSTAPSGSTGALAWLEPGSKADQLASLVVVGDSQGHELRRVALPHEPLILYETSASQTVLIHGIDNWMLTNLASGKTLTLGFGAVSPTDVDLLSHTGRWWVLGTEKGNDFLLDAQAEKLTALSSIGINQVFGTPKFSPLGTDLLAFTPDPTLITLGSSISKRAVAGGLATFTSFSPDGSQLIYTVKSGSSLKLTTERLDGTGSVVLLNSSVAVRAEFAEDLSHVLVIDTKGIAILDINSGKDVQISAQATVDTVTAVDWSGDRSRALVSYSDANDNPQCLYLDLLGGKVSQLTELADHSSTATAEAGDFRLFAVETGTAGAMLAANSSNQPFTPEGGRTSPVDHARG
jgi:WD40 repeat protein